jgi:hypothetical protein
MRNRKGKWSLRIGVMAAVAAAVCVVPVIAVAANNATGATNVTVNVAKNITFSATSVIAMAPDPSLAGGRASADVLLQVKTNDKAGYTVAASDKTTGLSSTISPIETFTPVATAGAASWPGANHFGAQAATADENVTFSAPYTGANWVGYNNAGPAGTQAIVWTGTGKTNLDEVTLTNQVEVDWTMGADTYTDTIYYTATTKAP